MQAGYRVHPDALHTYATAIDRAADRVSQITSSIGAIRVPADAFGKLPDADGLFRSYEDHADTDVQDCKDLADILRHTADGPTHSALHHEDSEQVTVSSIQDIQR
ncbi:hypothetical protein [Streptomyces pinistramenti]|uniref:hypothetical protein n=1 Tax=Streptomyces pinistramenti TaxID=2884812 RepID=UPI001D08227B|nr:hypothetical protein [Streptomyces pinistramenti]MCB5909012.1 hypothetical protein [Streptomyces pinistramenti]